MRRAAVLLCAVALAGCVGPYEAYPLKILDADQFEADKTFCRVAASGYPNQISLGDAETGAAKGFLDNVTAAPFTLAIPVVGAVTGAANAGVIGKMSGHTQANVERHCVDDMLSIDHAAVVARPND